MKNNAMVVDTINKEIGKIELTKELSINLTALGIIALLVFGYLFTDVYLLFSGKTGGIVSFEGGLSAMILFIFTMMFHELIHGIFISIYGGTPRYGMGIAYILPYFYATCKNGTRFSRREFIIIALAPLVVISLVGIILMAALPDIAQWMLIPLIGNSAGAVGDLYMTFVSLRYPKHVLVEDNIAGITFYGKQSDNPLNIAAQNITSNFFKGFTIAFVAVVLLSLVNPVYIFLTTLEFRFYFAFPQWLLISGFAGFVYSIFKSALNQEKQGEIL